MYSCSVSIIMPSYNCESFLEESINSVCEQSFKDWELIIVDDGSQDASFSIAQRIAEKDYRVKALRLEKNSGAAVARNFAIEAAQGRFIAFLDSDDLWDPQKLERQISFMLKNDYAFSCTGYRRQYINQELKNDERKFEIPINYKNLLKNNKIGCLTAVYDSKKIGKIFMPLIRKRQDFALWLKILREVKFVYCLPEILATYRIRENSISSNKIDLVKYNWKLFREIENLSISKSSYYLMCNIYNKMVENLR